jgi:hypothetical protein
MIYSKLSHLFFSLNAWLRKEPLLPASSFYRVKNEVWGSYTTCQASESWFVIEPEFAQKILPIHGTFVPHAKPGLPACYPCGMEYSE